MAKKTPLSRSDKILSWLKTHPAIDQGVICEKVGYRQGNLKKAMDGTRPLPDKYLEPLEKELEKYGFKK